MHKVTNFNHSRGHGAKMAINLFPSFVVHDYEHGLSCSFVFTMWVEGMFLSLLMQIGDLMANCNIPFAHGARRLFDMNQIYVIASWLESFKV